MSLTVARFDHIVVNCSNVAVTAAWYERVLGMRIERFGASGRVALRFGDQKINLRPATLAGDDPDWVSADAVAAGSEDLCFVAAEASADEVGAHLRECGVEITEGPVTRTGALGPITSHYCTDPDGNLIEVAVYQNPSS